MNKTTATFAAVMLFSVASLTAQNSTVYVKPKRDKALKEIAEKRKAEVKKANEVTADILKKEKVRIKAEREAWRSIQSNTKGVYPPASPEVFKKVYHFEPQPQFMTSTCWSFSAISFFESEIYRISGKKIKLAEMWVPYYEYIEKAMGYVKTRGKSYVAGGGQSNGVVRIWKKYGAAPLEAYSGVLKKGDRHNHGPLMKELKSYLKYIKKNNLWNEKENRKHIELIVSKHMGTPPSEFTYKGKKYTPESFLKETGLNLDDYYSVMSTKSAPFYTQAEYKYPDNWWHNKDYVNLPLKVWYSTIRKAINNGYSMVIGGDISEPGKLPQKDICFIPTFDIPGKYINQDSREYRISNKTTDDDHGIHLIGFKRYKGQDWFLIKDSGRSARAGKHHGYYFFRGDFVRLKMLTFTVHKDMLKEILPKLK